jgi:hypothetical protein
MSRIFPPPKDATGKPKENKGRSRRSVLTSNGRISWSRRRWSGGNAGGDCPVDQLVDETETAVSVGVRQLCCREGTQARSFARGRENLKHAAQLDAGEELFRQIVESEGKAVLAAGESGQLELDWSGAQCVAQTPAGPSTTRLYVSADGVLVPTITQAEKDRRRATAKKWRHDTPRAQRGKLKRLPPVQKGTDQRYKQIYLTAFYDQSQAHRLVGVTRRQIHGLEQLLKREAERVGLLSAQERLGLIDGAACLKSALEVLPLLVILLDFYHLSEHVGQAAAATLGHPETPPCKDWLDQVLHTVRHAGYGPFFQQLLDWRTKLRGHKRQAADALLGYVAPRQEMIRYDQCDQEGWDAGSGPMESMCGVTTDRIKGRGRRWDLDNAEAMMALEALYQSTGLWDRYWANALHQLN